MPEVTITKHPRGGYLLRSETVVPRPLEEVFAFFGNAANLEIMTPAWIKFHILTPQPIAMHEGCILDYKLRIHGLPLKWQSEITAWDPPYRFIDESRRGPYKWWRHEHTFETVDGGTRVTDEVHYGVPGGALMNALFVARDLRRIFNYRRAKLVEVFPATEREPLSAATAGSY